jgi:hypothetical protein
MLEEGKEVLQCCGVGVLQLAKSTAHGTERIAKQTDKDQRLEVITNS